MTSRIASRFLAAGVLLPLAGSVSVGGCHSGASPRTEAAPSQSPIPLRIRLPDVTLPIGDSVLTAAVMQFFPRLDQLHAGENVTAWVLADGGDEPQRALLDSGTAPAMEFSPTSGIRRPPPDSSIEVLAVAHFPELRSHGIALGFTESRDLVIATCRVRVMWIEGMQRLARPQWPEVARRTSWHPNLLVRPRLVPRSAVLSEMRALPRRVSQPLNWGNGRSAGEAPPALAPVARAARSEDRQGGSSGRRHLQH